MAPDSPDGRIATADDAVLYVTDGYWDFATLVASYGNLVYDRVVPEFIIVGLSYAGAQPDYDALRLADLSPVAMPGEKAASGQADRFLDTLERTVFPLVEREFRADPGQRNIAGSSLGGLFVLHALYARPQLFQGYIAASPAVVVGGDWIIGRAKAFAASGKPLPAREVHALVRLRHPGIVAVHAAGTSTVGNASALIAAKSSPSTSARR